MPLAFQKTIIGNRNYDASAPRPGFWRMFFYVRSSCARVCVSDSVHTKPLPHWEVGTTLRTPTAIPATHTPLRS